MTVQRNTFCPAEIPVTPDVSEFELLNTPEPDTTVQCPEPCEGALADSVALEPQII